MDGQTELRWLRRTTAAAAVAHKKHIPDFATQLPTIEQFKIF